ncbi:MAG: aspartate aminotransferase family protein [Chloroflexi bacterium]|nr:aspartate aminotransferase family protein [Chloroflexota bacterium]
MTNWLQRDKENQKDLLATAVQTANQFLDTLSERLAAVKPSPIMQTDLVEDGIGAAAALAQFQARFGAGISGSAGPRYLGFVTGGATPAALLGDWMAAVYDQNVMADMDSTAPQAEEEAIRFLRQLFGLPDAFAGAFVGGATLSNFVGLAQARQWAAGVLGVDVAQSGLYGLPPIPVLAATPHSSSYKSLAMLGMGKQNVTLIPTLPGREAMDVAALEAQLAVLNGRPAIVIASGGTVNTADFDDIQAIVALKERHNFWLHVDAAFGGFAACSPRFRDLLVGWELADSITIDAHKWLNVPYDSAMTFSRHLDLQVAAFQNTAVYLGPMDDTPSLVHWTPQNSRRFRALPAWMTLTAYGRSGYQEIVERNCDQAQWLGKQIEQSNQFRLLASVYLNVVCFTLVKDGLTMADVQAYLDRVRDDGRVFLTPTQYQGVPAIRAAISNWQTEMSDMEVCWQAMLDCL